MNDKRPIQEVLRLHITSCRGTMEIYERHNDQVETAFYKGMIAGLERAVEVADNREARAAQPASMAPAGTRKEGWIRDCDFDEALDPRYKYVRPTVYVSGEELLKRQPELNDPECVVYPMRVYIIDADEADALAAGSQARQEYPHLPHCNGDRRFPAGAPGHSCCCLNQPTDSQVSPGQKQ